MRHGKVVLAALAFLLLSSSAFALGTSISNSTAFNTQRKLARDGFGNLHLVWHDNGEIYYSTSADDGSTWTEPLDISNTPNPAAYSYVPSIAVDGRNSLHVAWQEKNPATGTYRIAYKKYSQIGGGGWEADFNIISSPNSAGSFTPSIAVDSNQNLHVAWYDLSGAKYQVYYRRYWDGLGWDSNIVRVSYTNDYAILPSIATDSNKNAHIAWSQGPWGENSSVYFNVYYSKFDSNSNSWSSPQQLSSSSPIEYNPNIAADPDNNLHLSWMARSSGGYEIMYLKYNAKTHSWDSAPTNISNNASDSVYPSTALYNGDVHIFWHDDNAGSFNVLHRVFDGNWQATEMITDSNSNVYPNASISTSARRLEWVWERGASPPYEIVLASRFLNHAPTVKLFFPPNNRWVSGSSNKIDFNIADRDNDSLTASLYYSATKGARGNLIASLSLSSICSNPDNSNMTDNNCSYSWNTSSLPDGNYFIDLNVSDSYSTSQASNDNNFAFSLFAPPFVQLNSPNGSEIVSGRDYNILFTVQDNNGSALYAAIYYSAAKGAKENLIASGLALNSGVCQDSDSSTKTDNNCSYDWNLSGVPTGNLYIDVNVYNSLKSSLVSSTSSFYHTPNTAPDMNLLAPLGGETWAGDLNTIRFNVRDREGDMLRAAISYRQLGIPFFHTSEADFNSPGASFSQTDTNSDGIVKLARNGVPFHESGTFVSKALDVNSAVEWKHVSWTALKPAGTDLNLQFRTSSDGTNWGNWSQALTSPGGSFLSDRNRYAQYRANFFTSVSNLSPALLDVNITSLDANSVPFTGTVLVSDLNLSSPAYCSSPSGSTLSTNYCHYDWNMQASALADMQYYSIDLNVYDSDLNSAKSSGAILYKREAPPGVRVVRPNGGETTGGSTYSIDFNVSDPAGRSLHAYIYYSYSQGAFGSLIASIDLNSSYCNDPDLTTITENSCSYVWQIPQSLDGNVLWIDLNAYDGKFAGYDSSDGNFTVTFDVTVPKITAVYPTAYNPKHIAPGQSVDVNFYYTERHPTTYYVTIQKSGSTICTKASSGSLASSGDANTPILVSDSCTPTSPAEGFYDLNLTLVDAANNYSTIIQYNAVRVDSTPPSLSVSGITSAQSYQNDLLFRCADNMSGCLPQILYYFSPSASCSSLKSAYDSNSSNGALSIAAAHSDYFCAWAEDLVGNSTRISAQKLSIDPTVYVLEQQAVQPRVTALADANSYCTVTIDQNIIVDCAYPTSVKFKYYPAHISRTYTEEPRLVVSQPQQVSVVATKKFGSYSSPNYYFNFVSGDSNLVSGANKAYINSIIQRRVLPLLQSDGSVELGTLYVKVQVSPPS